MIVRRLFALVLVLGCAFAAHGAPPSTPEAPPPPDAPTPAPSKRAWVGVFFGDAVDGGVQILEVVPDGPAAKAGLASGDLVIRINGTDVAARGDVSRALDGRAPGDTLAFTVLRGGKPREARLVLGASPSARWTLPRVAVSPVAPVSPVVSVDVDVRASVVMGIGVGEIPPELRKHYGGPAEAGVLVIRVEPKGPAASSLKVGDLVVSVAGAPIAEEDDLDDALSRRGSGPVPVTGVRSQKPFTTAVDVALKSPEQRAREARVRALETTIGQMEKELAELKRQLAALSAKP